MGEIERQRGGEGIFKIKGKVQRALTLLAISVYSNISFFPIFITDSHCTCKQLASVDVTPNFLIKGLLA